MAARTLLVAKYIGAPWRAGGRDPAGWDPWGCVLWVAKEEAGIALPDYADCGAAAEAMRTGRDGWTAIDPADARAGDVVLVRGRPAPAHAGLAVEPGWMVHVEDGRDTVCEPYDTMRWKPRLIGMFRHG